MAEPASFFVDLTQLELLCVSGADSARFLQGQLTCDVDAADESHCINGALCNNKGRVLTSFLLLRQGEDFYLQMKPGLLEGSKAHLDKYIVFFKATTKDASAAFHRLGLYGTQAASVLAELGATLPEQAGQITQFDQHLLLRRPGLTEEPPRFELWLAPEQAPALLSALREALPAGEVAQWEVLDLRQGLWYLESEAAGEHTPQVLNYDINGFVSFTKGCYTGQEIVARMHYRGQAKRRSYPFRLAEPSVEAVNGDRQVYSAEGKRAGEVLTSLRLGDSLEGLALLQAEQAEGGASLQLANGARIEVQQPEILKTGSS